MDTKNYPRIGTQHAINNLQIHIISFLFCYFLDYVSKHFFSSPNRIRTKNLIVSEQLLVLINRVRNILCIT